MNDYWERRQAQNMWEYMESAEETARQIAALYERGYRYLSSEIQEIYERYRDKHTLTDEQARQLLNIMQNPTDIEELKSRLKAAENGSQEYRELLSRLESVPYQHRISRLKDVQRQIDTIMTQIYHQELKTSQRAYTKLCEDVYYKSIFGTQQKTGFGFSFSLVDQKKLDHVLHSKWSGTNYSKRIWDNTQQLAEQLKEALLTNLITGRTDNEAAKSIQYQFAKGASNARRLVRTESCYLANQMEMRSYEECGIEKYRFVATLDLRTSEVCRGLDGKTFPVSGQQPGENCPPMHPYCRSTTISDIAEEELAKLKRRARDPETGETKTVPANMTYEQWYERNVKGHTEAERKKEDKGSQQNYKSSTVDVNDKINTEYKGIPCSASKATKYDNIYISDGLKLKPKQLDYVNTRVNGAVSIIGNPENYTKPRVIICNSTELPARTIAAYTIDDNTLRISSVVSSKKGIMALPPDGACSNDQNSIYVHEMLHWKDAQTYVRKTGKTEGYLKNNIEKSQRAIDKLMEKGYDIYDISTYASACLKEGRFDEAYTEYRVLKFLRR